MTDQAAEWILLNGDGAVEIPIADLNHLDRELDLLADEAKTADRPTFMHIYPAAAGFRDGPVLGFGIGESFSFLTWGHTHARGDGDKSDWYYGNQWSELSPGARMAVDTAREAVREFVRTGERPTNVDWTEG